LPLSDILPHGAEASPRECPAFWQLMALRHSGIPSGSCSWSDAEPGSSIVTLGPMKWEAIARDRSASW
jgi:hypothetical protein